MRMKISSWIVFLVRRGAMRQLFRNRKVFRCRTQSLVVSSTRPRPRFQISICRGPLLGNIADRCIHPFPIEEGRSHLTPQKRIDRR